MKVNQLDFKRTSVMFSWCVDPVDLNEIYIDGQKLSDIFPGVTPLWTEELYFSLMRSSFLRAEPFVVAMCKCGCLGCDDTKVYIDETENFIIWHNFIDLDDRPIKPGLVFIFDRKQYYDAVDTILNGIGEERALYYAGDLLVSWRDKRRLQTFAQCLNASCILKWNFDSILCSGREKVLGSGREKVLEIFRHNLVGKCDIKKGVNGNLYMIRSSESLEEKGYYGQYLEIYHYEDYEVAVFVAFKMAPNGKIDEILLSKTGFY